MKRSSNPPNPALLGTGMANKAGNALVDRKRRTQSQLDQALEASRKARGSKGLRQY